MVEVAEKKIKIIIADDHEIFLLGLSSFLKNSTNIDIVGKTIDGDQILHLIETQKPDLLILDFLIPGTNGIDLILNAKSIYPKLKTIIISNITDEKIVNQCKKSGIDGYVFKSEPKENLLQAIEEIMQGGVYFVTGNKMKNDANKIKVSKNNPFHKLSPKELEFIGYFTNGLTYAEIAQKMDISDRTVNTHRVNVTRKLGKLTLGELINLARTWGIN